MKPFSLFLAAAALALSASAGEVRTISVNFTGALGGDYPVSTGDYASQNIGYGAYARPGNAWMDVTFSGDGGTATGGEPTVPFNGLTFKDDTDETAPYRGVKLFFCSRGRDYTYSDNTPSGGNTQMLHTYLDNSDGTDHAGFKLTGLPFARYTVIVYFNRDGDGTIPAYSVNGTYYIGTAEGSAAAASTDGWGAPHGLAALEPGTNTLIVTNLTGITLTVKAPGTTSNGRGCISGFQVVGELAETRTVSVNFRGTGNGGEEIRPVSTGEYAADPIGFPGYAVAGSNWVECAECGGAGGVPLTPAAQTPLRDDTGDRARYAGVGFYLCSRGGTWQHEKSVRDGNTEMLRAYLDNDGNGGVNNAGFKLTGLPFTRYTAVIYFNRDFEGGIPAYSVNGAWYKGSNAGTVAAAESDTWGSPFAATALSEAANTLIVPGLSAPTLEVKASKTAGGRGCISGFQILGDLPAEAVWAGGDGLWGGAAAWTPGPWRDGFSALFPAGGAGRVGVDARAAAAALAFNDSYTLTNAGGSIRIDGPVDVAEGRTAAILAPVSGHLAKSGGGTFVFDPALSSFAFHHWAGGAVSLNGGTLAADFTLAGGVTLTNGVFRRASAAAWKAEGAPSLTVASGAEVDFGLSRPPPEISLSADSAGTLAAVVPNPLAENALITAAEKPGALSVRFRNRLGEEIPAVRYTVDVSGGRLTYRPVSSLVQPFSAAIAGDTVWTAAGWKDANGTDVPEDAWHLAGGVGVVKATVSAGAAVLTVDTNIVAATFEILGGGALTLKFQKGGRIAADVTNGTGQAAALDLSEWNFTEEELGPEAAVVKPVITGSVQGLALPAAVPPPPAGWAVRLDTSAGIAFIYEKFPAVVFTDPAGWKASMAFPETARQDAAPQNPSYAFDGRFTRLLTGSREATVASVTGGSGNIWGVHSWNYPPRAGIVFDRDIFLDVCGGAFHIVSAGLTAGWESWIKNAAVKGRQLTQLSGTARANYLFGAGEQGGQNWTLDGDAGVVVRDAAVVAGSVVGGWSTYHNKWPNVNHDTAVLIKNVQSDNSAGALNGLPSGLIIGGSAWGSNTGSSSWIGGNASVTVDIPPEAAAAGPVNFVKTIIGGSRSAGAGQGGGTQEIAGNTSVTISAPTNVTFTAPVYAGSVYAGAGAVRVYGTATLTIGGGTFACALRGGVADGAKTIVFNGPACFGADASIEGFGAASSGGGAELRVLPGGRLSYDAAIGPGLPPFTRLDGTVFVSASIPAADIAAGRKIHVATLADGFTQDMVDERFSGNIVTPDTRISTSPVFTLEEGDKVMLSAARPPLVWNSTDGEWTDLSFNNAPGSYRENALLFFSDSAADADIAVTVKGGKRAEWMTFDNTAATAYRLDGDAVAAGAFAKTGLGNVTVDAPLRMEGGLISFTGDSHVNLADVGGTAGGIGIAARDAGTAGENWGHLIVNLATNDFTLNGPVSIGNGQTLTLASALAGRRTVSKPVDGDYSGAAFLPTASSPDAELRFTGWITSGRIDKHGPGTVRFDCNASMNWKLTVYEGKLVVNGRLECTATAEEPVRVLPGAAIRFEGNQDWNRMPNGGRLSCDGGIVELSGVNPFNSDRPNFILENRSTLFADCLISPEKINGSHIKVETVSLDNSDIVIGGKGEAYANEGLRIESALTVQGACSAGYAPDPGTKSNILCLASLDVLEGGRLNMAVRTDAFEKNGSGTLAAAAGSVFPDLKVNAGALEIPSESGTFTALSLADGTLLDLSADRSVLRVDGAMAIAEGDAVSVNLAGRVLYRDERENGRRYIIRWGAPPAGELVPSGLAGCLIEKRDDGAVLERYGTAIIIR